MTIEVARWRDLQDNADRRRLPRKFTEGISPTLTQVEDGSVIARIALTFAAGVGSLLPTTRQTSFDRTGRRLLDGVGKFNRADRLQRGASLDHVTPLDPLDVPSQLEELRPLKDGRYDGRGIAPPPAGLDWLAEAFNDRLPDTLALPHVHPVAEGGVRFEWLFGRQDLSLEIDLGRKEGARHSLDLDLDDEEARSLDLDAQGDRDRFVERLQVLSGAHP